MQFIVRVFSGAKASPTGGETVFSGAKASTTGGATVFSGAKAGPSGGAANFSGANKSPTDEQPLLSSKLPMLILFQR